MSLIWTSTNYLGEKRILSINNEKGENKCQPLEEAEKQELILPKPTVPGISKLFFNPFM